MQKMCRNCRQTKLLNEFSKATANKDGHSNRCKRCVSAHNKAYWRTPKGRISQIYAAQCVTSRDRGHPPPAYTQQELFEWSNKNGLEELIQQWKKTGYKKDFIPSIDRIDDAHGYSLTNIQLVTWHENNNKMYEHRKSGKRITKQNRTVIQFTLDNTEVAHYPSISAAARATGICRTNINRACSTSNPSSKTAGGFYWSYV